MAGEHENVHVTEAPDPADHFQTIDVRKPVIQKHDSGAVMAHCRYPADTCSLEKDSDSSTGHHALDQAADVFIVFNHYDQLRTRHRRISFRPSQQLPLEARTVSRPLCTPA